MASHNPYHEPPFPKDIDSDERRALLRGPSDEVNPLYEPQTKPEGWSSKRVAIIALLLVILFITGGFVRTFSCAKRDHRSTAVLNNRLLSNGTDEFKPTVLIVSIDGLRADYLDRGLTPHLLALSQKGLRAKTMKPVFPTLTFPNHWSLMTGLYAESHGIVGNNFWDPASQEEFHYNEISSAWNPSWWLGEPIWETAQKAGIITANLMWPGPPRTKSGISSTYFVPWKDKVPLREKLDQILQWIDLPLDIRPQLIMAYEPSLDQAGHATGPYSKEINETLLEVDKFAMDLHDALADRHLASIVDIVFVSDHGMTDTSDPELIYMDDILGKAGLEDVAHEDGWPAMGLRFKDQTNVTKHLKNLLHASNEHPEKFGVYTHETMPKKYHFANNDRIAPIYVVPKIGYVLTTKAEGDVRMSKGNHGYDNEAPSMHAMFVAHGPFSTSVKQQHQQTTRFARSKKQGWHSTSDNTYILETFPNVEVYNLVTKLLGISEYAAPNNGTAGFWDRYL